MLGLFLGLSIIMSIGAQNIFIIKQGVKREYSYYSAFICFISDLILISLSISSVHFLLNKYPLMNEILLIIAILFLTVYGLFSIHNGLNQKSSLQNDNLKNTAKTSFWKITLIAFSFSLLNPHAILDVFVLIGGAANKYRTTIHQYQFVLGAMTASLIWFFGLTTISVYLNKLLYYKRAWSILETISGVLMLGIALNVAGKL